MEIKPIILVVDDEEDVLGVFQQIIPKTEYTVLIAKTGKEALEQVEKESPNLVVLDLKLPDISGIDVLRRVKRVNNNIEVIMITGYGTIETAKKAMRLGAYDYITKPFDNSKINTLIKSVLLPDSIPSIKQ